MAIMPWEIPIPKVEVQTITNTIYVPEKPKLLFGLDENMVIGIIMGILILNFIQYITGE